MRGSENKMAKYTIRYACGHGSTTKQLYGKETDRSRHITWAETNMVCPECYKNQKREEDAAADKIVYVESLGGQPIITLRAQGQIEANKDALKALGFQWTRDYGGVLGMLETKEPPLALVATRKYTADDAWRVWYADIETKLTSLGYRLVSNINPLDLAVMKTFAAADEARVLANPKPKRPSWYSAIMTAAGKGATWNLKIYGGRGARRIYVSGSEHRITDDQAAEIETYASALEAHRKATRG